MKVNEQKQLILTENDVDKLLLHRLEQIQSFLENNVDEIKSQHKSEADIILLSGDKKETDIRKLMQDMILDYLKGLVDKNKANITLRMIYTQLKNKEIELGLVQQGEKYDWLKAFSTHINQLDHYAKKSIESIKQDKHYAPTNPKVITLLRTYDSMKTDERIHRSMAATHWEKFFKRYATMKKNMRGVSKEKLNTYYLGVKSAFLLINKQFIEEVTSLDCRKLSEKIYMLPKRWNVEVSKGEPLENLLTNAPSRVISKKTIKAYLHAFKSFMRYAVKEEIIQNSLVDFVDIPVKIEGTPRAAFTVEELHKIFNPKTYPDPHCRNYMARFWVPIIALYHGCRLNEICQLDVTDIVQENGIPCFSINDKGEDQHLKNKGSNRIIPIHPQLRKMNFLSYVEYQRKTKEKKLFSELNQIARGRYSRKVQSWFAHYLDKIGLSGKDKVFHSFRHTFETKAVEKKIPAEYQNAICGWTDQGIGQRLYARKKDTNVMLEELSKIDFPIHRELSELHKIFKDTFVMKSMMSNVQKEKVIQKI